MSWPRVVIIAAGLAGYEAAANPTVAMAGWVESGRVLAPSILREGGPARSRTEFERVYNNGRSVQSGFYNERDSPCSLFS